MGFLKLDLENDMKIYYILFDYYSGERFFKYILSDALLLEKIFYNYRLTLFEFKEDSCRKL